ncbi:hypothetical protein [Paracoccus sp. MC1854]|uniref:hypothetical protein n=1 Tax=Paracoccus sp. MC1854 TaxID=2760306 RepID=UPI002103AF5B|nr:hypothetical protein [Paracoccus sp. MC1854]
MGILDLFKRREPVIEKRAAAMGYTADLIAARAEWLAGTSRVAELTSTVQSCVSLWKGPSRLPTWRAPDCSRARHWPCSPAPSRCGAKPCS